VSRPRQWGRDARGARGSGAQCAAACSVGLGVRVDYGGGARGGGAGPAGRVEAGRGRRGQDSELTTEEEARLGLSEVEGRE
jgi:hypothetical protein